MARIQTSKGLPLIDPPRLFTQARQLKSNTRTSVVCPSEIRVRKERQRNESTSHAFPGWVILRSTRGDICATSSSDEGKVILAVDLFATGYQADLAETRRERNGRSRKRRRLDSANVQRQPGLMGLIEEIVLRMGKGVW